MKEEGKAVGMRSPRHCCATAKVYEGCRHNTVAPARTASKLDVSVALLMGGRQGAAMDRAARASKLMEAAQADTDGAGRGRR
jgi:hypothetical protein